VSVENDAASVLSTVFHDGGHIEIELLAEAPLPEMVLFLTDREGRRETISLAVEAE